MKKFLKKIGLFSLLMLFLAFGVFCLADGKSDFYYHRFTTPQQTSLILGTSKAAQGVQPYEINNALNRNDIYNYSFTLAHTSFGPQYFNSIKKKLDPNTKNGIFIITVDPFSISAKLENLNDPEKFREKGRFISIEKVTGTPNLEYLLHHYPHQYIYILTRKLEFVNNDYLHDDGWIEINLQMDSSIVEKRTQAKIIEYQEARKDFAFSNTRFEYLEKTIELLQKHGKVYLVRLPVVTPLWELEDVAVPGFENKMTYLSEKFQIDYLKMNKSIDSLVYTDGYHLYKTSGKHVSREIGEWISGLD